MMDLSAISSILNNKNDYDDDEFQSDVLRKRQETLSSYRMLHHAQTPYIQTLERDILSLKSRQEELQRQIIEKDSFLRDCFHKLEAYEKRLSHQEEVIQSLTMKIHDSDERYRDHPDQKEPFNCARRRNRRVNMETMTKAPALRPDIFQFICRKINVALLTSFGDELSNFSMGGLNGFYQEIVVIFQSLEEDQRVNFEDLYVLCDSIIYLLQLCANAHAKLSNELKASARVSRKARHRIWLLLDSEFRQEEVLCRLHSLLQDIHDRHPLLGDCPLTRDDLIGDDKVCDFFHCRSSRCSFILFRL